MSESPLARLIKPKEELDEAAQTKLADMLEPYVWLDPDNLGVHFKPDAPSLTTLKKVLIYLLARKAISTYLEIKARDDAAEAGEGEARQHPEASPVVTPKDVEEGTKLSGGTVRPKLTELHKKKYVLKKGTAYEVSPYYLSEIEKLIGSKSEESNSQKE